MEYSNNPSRDVLKSNLVLFTRVTNEIPSATSLLQSVLDTGLQRHADPAYSLPYFNLHNPNFSNPFTKK